MRSKGSKSKEEHEDASSIEEMSAAAEPMAVAANEEPLDTAAADVVIPEPAPEEPMDAQPAVAIPAVSPSANKYSRGELIVVAGSDRYTGAAVLCARASQRMGAGYTEVITAKKAVDIVRIASASLVVRDVDDWDPTELRERKTHRPWALAIGPGFVGSDEEAKLVRDVLKNCRRPVLVDGGGLYAVATKKALKILANRADKGIPTVLTPHEGEAARLTKALGLTFQDSAKMAAGLAYALRSIVVLKGPDTYISDGKTTVVMTEGSAALAKAGTGDVLSGMIGALLAQGVAPMQASFTASTIHARAGLLAAHLYAETSVIAEDIIDCIPAIIKQSV